MFEPTQTRLCIEAWGRRNRSSVRFIPVDDPWGHTTDWHDGGGVAGHVTKRKRYGRGVPAHVTTGSFTVVSEGGHTRQSVEVVSAARSGRGAGGGNS